MSKDQLKDLFSQLTQSMTQSLEIIKNVSDHLSKDDNVVEEKPKAKKGRKPKAKPEVAQKEPSVVISEDFRVIKHNTKPRKGAVQATGENLFTDDGTDRDANHNYLGGKTSRRPPAKLVPVVCSRCHRSFTVPEVLARSYYVCEGCAGG